MANLNFNNVHTDKKGHITLSGVGSGIDSRMIVDKIMEAKNLKADRIIVGVKENDEKIAILGDCKEKMEKLLCSLKELKGELTVKRTHDVFAKKTASLATLTVNTSSAPSLMAAEADSSAEMGSHTLEIIQIAQAHRIKSQPINQAANSALGYSGTIVFNDSEGSPKATIVVAPSNSVIDLVKKINMANIGIFADRVSVMEEASPPTIPKTYTSYQHIVMSSEEMGTLNQINISTSSTDDIITGLGLATLSGDTYVPNNEVTSPQDAHFKVDSVEIHASSNIVKNALNGVTLQFFKAEPDTIINLSIGRDLPAIKNSIEKVAENFNSVMRIINQQSKKDSVTKKLPPLYGDSGLGRLKTALVNFSLKRTGDGSLTHLEDIGLQPHSYTKENTPLPLEMNTLKLNSQTLDEKLLENINEIQKFLSFTFTSSDVDLDIGAYTNDLQDLEEDLTLTLTLDGSSITEASLSDGEVTLQNRTIKVTSGPAQGLTLLFNGQSSRTITFNYTRGLAVQAVAALDPFVTPKGDVLIQRNPSKGILDDIRSDDILKNEIHTIRQTSATAQSQRETVAKRLEKEEEMLLEKFNRMESAMSESQNVLKKVRQVLKQQNNRDD